MRSTGTVRKNRIKVQQTLGKKAPRGSHVANHDKNSGVNYITVMDSKPVSILSSATGVTPLSSMQRYSKDEHKKTETQFPHVVMIYNKYIGGVDVHDYRCNRVMLSIRSKKWTWVILLRIIQSSITNATILWNLCCDKSKNISTKDFCREISKYYLGKSKTGDLIAHKCDSRPKKSCSVTNCSIRTTKFCLDCNDFYCVTCFNKIHSVKKLCSLKEKRFGLFLG